MTWAATSQGHDCRKTVIFTNDLGTSTQGHDCRRKKTSTFTADWFSNDLSHYHIGGMTAEKTVTFAADSWKNLREIELRATAPSNGDLFCHRPRGDGLVVWSYA